MVFAASSEIEGESAAAWPAPPSRVVLAARDLREGWEKRWMWAALALQDIKLRYRGSVLGPFWLTVSTLVMVVAMGVIYPYLFHMEVARYVPYLGIGLIVWQALSGIINEGCETFLREQAVIQQVPVPFSVHAYRCVCRNFISLAHSLLIVPVGMAILQTPLNWRVLEIIPAFALLAVNGFWLALLLGLLSARFRDIPPIIASFLQVLFFLTPVIWPIDALGGRWLHFVGLNPFFAVIDTIRSPLLGMAPADTSWLILLLTTLLGSAGTFLLFARFRLRIAYWI